MDTVNVKLCACIVATYIYVVLFICVVMNDIIHTYVG